MKPKLDPKIRFQNTSFRRRLAQARSYKRNNNPLIGKGGGFNAFLSKLGLNNVWFQVALLILFCFTVYICYVPNFLYIQSINVQGLNEQNKAIIMASVNNYFSTRSLVPKKNYIFVNESSVLNFLSINNPTFDIEFVTKKWPNSLTIGAKNKHISFYAFENNRLNIFSDDGMLVKSSYLQASTTPSSTIQNLIELTGYDPRAPEGAYAINPAFQPVLKTIKHEIFQGTGQDLQRLELNIPEGDYTAITSAGYKIFSNTSLPIGELQKKISLILSDYSPAQETGLFYIDTRYKDRAFVCFKDQPCAKSELFPNPESSASSTSDNAMQ